MYYIHEDGDEAMGYTWDLYSEDNGKLVRIGTFYGESHASKVMSAIRWYESFEGGRMSIPEPKKKPTRAPKPPAIDIIFTPAKKKKRT